MAYHGVIFTDFLISHPEQHQRTLGAYSIASMLRRRGLKIKVIDFTFSLSSSDIEKICSRYISTETKFVGLSSTFLSYKVDIFDNLSGGINDTFSQVVKLSRKVNPDIKILQGGGWPDSPHPLVEKIFFGQDIENEIINYISDFCLELKSVPFEFTNEIPRFDEEDYILNGETLPVETARGCVFNCKFCGFTLRGKKKNDYVREARSISDHIYDLNKRFGTENFYIAEDTFNESIEKLDSLVVHFERKKIRANFVCYARIDLLYRYPKMLDLMYQLGVRAIMFGIETFSAKAGVAIGKGLSPALVQKTLFQIKERFPDLYLGSGFIVGLPGESLKSIIETNKWLTENRVLDHWYFQPLYLNPKSKNPNKSEFSTNASKYGYEITIDGHWSNGGLSFSDCFETSEILNQDNSRKRLSKAFPWGLFAALQYGDYSHLVNLTNKEIQDLVGLKKLMDYKLACGLV